MNKEEVLNLYHSVKNELKAKYPCLNSWKGPFFSNAMRSALGIARRSNDGRKEIRLSNKLINLNKGIPTFKKQLEDTIRHEFAHALDWEWHKGWGHGDSWKACCELVGANPERCYNADYVTVAPNHAKYAIRNRNSGRVFNYYNRVPTFDETISAVKWFLDMKASVCDTMEIVDIRDCRSHILPA